MRSGASSPAPAGRARRLLVVIDSLEVGGAELQLVATLPLLARRGWRVEVLTLTGKEPLASALSRQGIVVHTQRRRGATRAGRLAWFFATLLKLLAAPPAPVVYVVLPYATALAGLPALLLRCRFAVGRRSRNVYQRELPRVIRALERRAVLGADLLIVNSQLSADDLLSEGADPKKIRLVPNGVDRARARSAIAPDLVRQELSVAPDAFVVLTVANLFPYKGHADLLDALSMLESAGRLPCEWAAIFAGRDPAGGAERARIEARARALGLARRIRMVGERAEVGSLLAIADLVVCPSHEEGLSNALLEAMAAGVPIVSTDVGGHREALAGGRAGLIVLPKSPQDLAGAIARLVESPKLRRELGAAAGARVREAYSMEHSAAALSEALETLIDIRASSDHVAS